MRCEKCFHFYPSIRPFCLLHPTSLQLLRAPVLPLFDTYRKFVLPIPKPGWFDYIMESTGVAFLFLLLTFLGGRGEGAGLCSFPPYLMCNSARPRRSFLSHIFYSYKATRESILVNIASSCRPFRLRSAVIKPERRGCTCPRAWLYFWMARWYQALIAPHTELICENQCKEKGCYPLEREFQRTN